MFCLSLLLPVLLAFATRLQNPVWWTFQAVPSQTGYVVQLEARLSPGWHLYSQWQPRGAFALPTRIRFTPAADLSFTGPTIEKGDVQRVREAVLGTQVNQCAGRVQFLQTVVTKSSPAAPVCGTITYQACMADRCLPPQTIAFSIRLP